MCFRHWKRVPRVIQARVWKHYRDGQCDDKNASALWHQAADEAIAEVAEKEAVELEAKAAQYSDTKSEEHRRLKAAAERYRKGVAVYRESAKRWGERAQGAS